MSLKNGKKPLSEKQKPKLDTYDDLFSTATTISPELKKELESQGLKWRWGSYKQLKDMDGYHPRGWKIYRRKESDIIDRQDAGFGQSPDGVIRRGDMILVVKPEANWRKHKEYLKNKARRYGKDSEKAQAERLRQLAREHNVKPEISEGYDD